MTPAVPHPRTCSRRFLSIHRDGFYSVSEYYGAVLIDAYNVRSLPLRTGLSGPMTSNYTSFVNFEWDEDKNQENIRKHGLDFADAWEIFEAPMLTALDTRAEYGEDRWTGIGFLGNRIVVVVFTERGEDTTRIISLRKALKHERKFEDALRDRLGTH